MERDELITLIENTRASLVAEINSRMDSLIRQIDGGSSIQAVQNLSMPLMGDTRILKGKKVVSVICGEDEILVSTWKKAIGAILAICNRQESYHQALLSARGKITGRDRSLLGASPEGMASPLKIDDDLYLEAHYDTDSLFYILKEKIFPEIGFDGSNILIVYKPLKRQ